VKLKLSLLGVAVNNCGVCLSQFRNEEWAVLGPQCLHAFVGSYSFSRQLLTPSLQQLSRTMSEEVAREEPRMSSMQGPFRWASEFTMDVIIMCFGGDNSFIQDFVVYRPTFDGCHTNLLVSYHSRVRRSE
jgi:hypothetical protein